MSRTIWLAGDLPDRADRVSSGASFGSTAACTAVTEQLIRHERPAAARSTTRLQAKNDHIRDINDALVDSNRIKDRYVCHYIDLSVHYIKQIDAFRREVCRIAKHQGRRRTGAAG